MMKLETCHQTLFRPALVSVLSLCLSQCSPRSVSFRWLLSIIELMAFRRSESRKCNDRQILRVSTAVVHPSRHQLTASAMASSTRVSPFSGDDVALAAAGFARGISLLVSVQQS
ncbi:uncharacterized protein LOC111024021 isoform X3 [Momordica charantia]|uniref:Uncharacterized protein LOC111024021 isoform X3 n=1 Tax=Momordica charantia TaxID=3673 RepID=A0A6J1DSN1_MOMCH|nr:uncharacterized protein LOC111024021 isoform X3 [Momordica charantia]